MLQKKCLTREIPFSQGNLVKKSVSKIAPKPPKPLFGHRKRGSEALWGGFHCFLAFFRAILRNSSHHRNPRNTQGYGGSTGVYGGGVQSDYEWSAWRGERDPRIATFRWVNGIF